MKYLAEHWQSRTLIILFVSVIIAIALVGLEYTDWANKINRVGYNHDEGNSEGKRNIPDYMMYILPFVKELILIGVPLFITLFWLKMANAIRKLVKRR